MKTRLCHIDGLIILQISVNQGCETSAEHGSCKCACHQLSITVARREGELSEHCIAAEVLPVMKPDTGHMRPTEAPGPGLTKPVQQPLALLQPSACLVTHGLHLKQMPAGGN